MKRIYVISGGTMVHIRPHFSLCAPAYGTVGYDLTDALVKGVYDKFMYKELRIVPIFTRMVEYQGDRWGTYGNIQDTCTEGVWYGRKILSSLGLRHVETNEDLKTLIEALIQREDTRGIIMAAAVCDWEPKTLQEDRAEKDSILVDGDFTHDFGKEYPRLSTRLPGLPDARKGISLKMRPADKLIGMIRRERKDIFLVSFKTTAGVSREETYVAGLKSLKGSSSNLVLANDVQNHHNVVVTPEEFPYYCDTREEAVRELADMVLDRIRLDFIRTRMVPGDKADLVKLHKKGKIPSNFLPVLQHAIQKGAFKVLPWAERTSGHFGCVVLDKGLDFIRVSSVRKVNHNKVLDEGVVKIVSDDGNSIIARGGKPSVGEHTQRMIYEQIKAHGYEVHSILHFHCPLRKTSGIIDIPTAAQRPYECGSVQCGLNTSTNMMQIEDGIWAVHLEGHGPNIAWHRDVDPQKVIDFIEGDWDLSQKSGGNL